MAVLFAIAARHYPENSGKRGTRELRLLCLVYFVLGMGRHIVRR